MRNNTPARKRLAHMKQRRQLLLALLLTNAAWVILFLCAVSQWAACGEEGQLLLDALDTVQLYK